MFGTFTKSQTTIPIEFMKHFRTSFALWSILANSKATTFIPATHQAFPTWLAKQRSVLVLMAETTGAVNGIKLVRGHLKSTRHIGIKIGADTKIEDFQPAPFLRIEAGQIAYVVWRLINDVPIEAAETVANIVATKLGGTPCGHLLPLPGTQYNGNIVKLVYLLKDRCSVLTDFQGLEHARVQTPQFLKANTLKMKPLAWLWRNAVLRGALSVLAGPGGVGKSTVAASIAAIVTTGGVFPDGEKAEQGAVIFCEGEDDPESVTLPRLQAAGADLSRVIIGPVCDLSQSVEALEAAVKELGEPPALLVLSPVRCFFGKESYIDTEVRARLAPVLAWAERHNVAILGVTHPPRGKQDIAGAGAWRNAARAGFFVDKDKRRPTRRILSPLKSNSGRDDWQLAYAIEGVKLRGGVETSHVVWEADPAAAPEPATQPPETLENSSIEAAITWLRRQLASGPQSGPEIKTAADKEGISKGTLYRAANRCGVTISEGSTFTPKTWDLT